MKQKKAKRIVIFGGSFNPPGKHHRQIAKELAQQFDLVIIVPCGPRLDKPSANVVELKHRKEMIRLAFAGLPKTLLDFSDLDNNIYTPTYLLQKRYEVRFPDSQIWHLVGSDIVAGGHNQKSEIHRVWQRGNKIWKNLNFVVSLRPDYKVYPKDLPPKAKTIKVKNANGSGTEIRKRIAQNKSISNLVILTIASYIREHRLYCQNQRKHFDKKGEDRARAN